MMLLHIRHCFGLLRLVVGAWDMSHEHPGVGEGVYVCVRALCSTWTERGTLIRLPSVLSSKSCTIHSDMHWLCL